MITASVKLTFQQIRDSMLLLQNIAVHTSLVTIQQRLPVILLQPGVGVIRPGRWGLRHLFFWVGFSELVGNLPESINTYRKNPQNPSKAHMLFGHDYFVLRKNQYNSIYGTAWYSNNLSHYTHPVSGLEYPASPLKGWAIGHPVVQHQQTQSSGTCKSDLTVRGGLMELSK